MAEETHMAPVISLANTTLSFGDIKAINSLSFDVPKGKITVLLGPNGAGKTTAIRMITGALAPTQGTVNVLGMNPSLKHVGEKVRLACGVVSAKPSLYDRLNGFDNLRYAAELYGLNKGEETDEKIIAAATTFGIEHALEQRVGGFSTGMKTRLALARSVLHDPEILLLDEPTSGLDPESSQAVLELIRAMTSNGNTVLLCTHLLSEAEGLADEVVVMEEGTSLLTGTPKDLAAQFWPHPTVTFTAVDPSDLHILTNAPGVIRHKRSKQGIKLELHSLSKVPDLVSLATQNGVQITAVTPHIPSLEDIYFAIRAEHRAEQPSSAPVIEHKAQQQLERSTK